VLACLTLFQNGSTEVTLKARGNAISKAVDAAQIIANRYVPDAKLGKIAISTEEVKSTETGVMSAVSSIEIRISV